MSVICFGELLIDFVASETGVTVGEASGFVKAPGGAPANVAVGVARLGHPSAFLGQVGDDPFGHFLEGVLRADKVDTRGLRFSPEARTALAPKTHVKQLQVDQPDDDHAKVPYCAYGRPVLCQPLPH